MKKFVALIAALMMVLSCTAALADDTIIVALNPQYPPFEYVEGDEVCGFDADLIKAIAEKAGFAIEFEAMEYASVISSVAANPNCIGVSGISITDERKLTVNFSDPYINAGLVVVVKADSDFAKAEAPKAADLAGKTIGVQLGTTSDTAAEEITGLENVSQYSTFLDAIMDLQGNKLDAVIVDKPVGQALLASLKDDALVMVDVEDLEADWYGIEVNKDNTELLEKINTAMAELTEEGFFEELNAKYFGAEEAAAE